MFEALATKHSCHLLPIAILTAGPIYYSFIPCLQWRIYLFIHVLHRRFTAPLALSSTRMDDYTIKIQVMFPDDLRTIIASGSRLASAFINIWSMQNDRKVWSEDVPYNTGSWLFFPGSHPTKHTKSHSFFHRFKHTRTRHWPKRRAWWLVGTHGVMPSRYLNAQAVPPVVPRSSFFGAMVLVH